MFGSVFKLFKFLPDVHFMFLCAIKLTYKLPFSFVFYFCNNDGFEINRLITLMGFQLDNETRFAVHQKTRTCDQTFDGARAGRSRSFLTSKCKFVQKHVPRFFKFDKV